MGLIFFEVGPITVYTHGFFLLLGVLAAFTTIYYLAPARELDRSKIIDIVVYPLLAGLIGARITYFALYSNQFDSFWQIFQLWGGGLVSWGGFVAALAALYFVTKSLKASYFKWLDLFILSSFLGLAVGRLGSFLSGEYAGIPYDGMFSYAGVHPITLYQSFWNLLIFIVLLIIFKNLKNLFDDGLIAVEGVMLYSLGRFSIDFMRAESDLFWFLSLGQIVSLLVFAISLIIFVRITAKKE